jgi:hypothetical protein
LFGDQAVGLGEAGKDGMVVPGAVVHETEIIAQ